MVNMEYLYISESNFEIVWEMGCVLDFCRIGKIALLYEAYDKL